MNKVKIAILTISHHPKDTRLFYKFGQTLSKNNEVQLFVGNSNIEQSNNPSITKISFNSKIEFLKKSYKLIKKYNPEILICVEPITLIVGKLLKKDTKIVYDCHEFFASAFAHRFKHFRFLAKLFYQTIEKYLMKSTDLVIAVNHLHEQYLKKNSKKIITLTNSPIITETNNTEEKKIFDAVYIGTLSKEKGCFKILKSIEKIKSEIPNIQIAIAGKFVIQEEERLFKQLIKNDNLKDNIKYFGYVDKTEREEILRKSKIGICLLSPKVERYKMAFSVKIIEYLQFGLPVITNNFEILKENLSDEIAEFIEYNSYALAKTIVKILQKSDIELNKIKVASQKIVKEKLNWEIEAKKLNKAILELTNDSKRILYFAYFFPPLGGPAVQRSCKTIKYLSQKDFKVDVVTIKNILYHSYDEAMADECSCENIYRTASLDPMFLMAKKKNNKDLYFNTSSSLKTKIKSLFPIDEKIGWLPFAVYQGVKLCKKNNYKTIIVTIGPNSVALIGYLVSKIAKIPLIIDYRDHWNLNPYKQKHFGDKFESYLEKKILKHAKFITGISNVWKDEICKNYKIPNEKVEVIYNGWDEDDYQDVTSEIEDNKFIFSYIGNFYSLRTPKYFIQAIEELYESDKFPPNIEFRFIGNYFIREMEAFKNSEVFHLLKIIPQVSHKDAVKYQINSDVLMLFIASASGSGVITGKLFEYLRTQKTILAMIPEISEAKTILKEAGHNYFSTMEDVEMIKKNIMEIIHSDNQEYKIPNDYKRENQVQRLINYVSKM